MPGYACPSCSCSSPSRGQKTEERIARVVRQAGQRVFPAGQKNFEYLMKLPVDFRKNFHEKFHKKEICFRFQSNTCNLSSEECKLSLFLCWLRWLETLQRLQMLFGQDSLNFISSRPTEKVADVPPALPVSAFPPIVKPKTCPKRVLLLTSEGCPGS